MHPFVHLSILFWLYTALHCRSSISSNCLVFHTSGGISSSPAAFLFLILLRTESSSSLVKGPSLTSNCLLIILVIGSSVISGAFPSRFLKCCSHSFTLSCWLAAFNFALAVLFLLLTSFIVCQAILDCLSSTESLILSILSDFVCILPVLLDIFLLIDVEPFLVFVHLCLLGSFDSFWRQFSQVYVFL